LKVSENVRIALGILAVAWFAFVPVFAFLVLMSEARTDPPSALLLVHRGLPALILLAAVITSSWPLVVVALVTGAVTSLAVEFVKRRWPERWEKAGGINS
jgi:predicted neutral ceramidase superfamily lipid hydrolase